MSLLHALIVGLIQGLTEFIPVSSSGHLVLAQSLLGIDQPGITFEVVLHFGTLASVFWVFWKDIISLIKAAFTFPKVLLKTPDFDTLKYKQERYFIILLIIATIVTAGIGLAFEDFFKGAYSNVTMVGFMLLVTGGILFLTSIVKPKDKGIEKMKVKDSILVGLFQSFAIFPGISRSGSTIAGAIFSGLNRETAIRFSFILSIPAILGATLLELIDALKLGFEKDLILPYIVGFLVAAISGIVAIKWLVSILNRGKLYYFSFYCWVVGITVLVLAAF
ncbi:undecaprenyl-diphosphatase UppP [Proteinivorax hydrogeniformans]|uniref:Undecaprenyl-diphosphatase n=1 Tax=Proteinivorax hydrogeniformans TaxID=1826727 RepID=A0AAU8HQP8_9FIRM